MTRTELAAMPIAEKTQLMESLWESLSSETTATTSVVPAWQDDILAERGARLDQGHEPVSSLDDAKQRIRKQIAIIKGVRAN